MGCEIQEIGYFRDVRELVLIHNDVWNRAAGIIDLLTESTECFLAIDSEDNCVAGYAFVQDDISRGFTELMDITISPPYRGRGYGRRLMEHILKRSNSIKLCAKKDRERLVRFYKRLGFRAEAVYENYYGVGQDAQRMVWTKVST